MSSSAKAVWPSGSAEMAAALSGAMSWLMRIGEHSSLIPDLVTLNGKSIELVPLLVDELREGVVL